MIRPDQDRPATELEYNVFIEESSGSGYRFKESCMEPVTTFSLRLTPLCESDSEKVMEVYRQCRDFLALGPQTEPSLEMVVRDIRSCEEQYGVFYGIFLVPGELIGVISVVPRETNNQVESVYIELMMIIPAYRQKGVGRQVLKLIESTVKQKIGISRFLTSVQLNNSGAIRFWQTSGYQIMDCPELQPDATTVYHFKKEDPPLLKSDPLKVETDKDI
jgi:RimJ/RimL family protein N-acetyltransferase